MVHTASSVECLHSPHVNIFLRRPRVFTTRHLEVGASRGMGEPQEHETPQGAALHSDKSHKGWTCGLVGLNDSTELSPSQRYYTSPFAFLNVGSTHAVGIRKQLYIIINT